MSLLRDVVPILSGDQVAIAYAKRDVCHLVAASALCEYTRVVVQAGGGLGVWPARLAAMFGVVYTFEPDPRQFVDLTYNTSQFANVFRFQAALGRERGCVSLSGRRRDAKKMPDHAGLTHVVRDEKGVVPTMRVDDLGLRECDLLYLDVEGEEHVALCGAEKTLQRCRPVVGVEMNANAALAGSSLESTRDLLRGHRYRLRERRGSDELYVYS